MREPVSGVPRTAADVAAERRRYARVRALIPRGNTLPREVWLRRHRSLVILLAVLGPVLAVYGIAEGYGIAHAVAEAAMVAVFAAVAWLTRERRRIAALTTSLGLMAGSAILVHFSGGTIESHFAFFFVVVLLTLYEDWAPFVAAAAFVVLHHVVLGTVDPDSVFNRPDAVAQPLTWAGIHALFVVAAGLAAVAAWRANEEFRAATASAHDLAREQERSAAVAQQLAQVGSFEFDLTTGDVRWSPQLYKLFGLDPATFEPSYEGYLSRLHPGERDRIESAVAETLETGNSFSHRYRIVDPGDGAVRTLHARGDLVLADDGQPVRLVGSCQDVTERERAEQRAVQRAAAQQAVAELGEWALGNPDLDALYAKATETALGVLALEAGGVAEWVPGEDSFVIRSESGMADSVGNGWPAGPKSQSGATLLTAKPVVVDDWERERRFVRPALGDRLGVRSSVTVMLQRREYPYGVFGVFSRQLRQFDADEVSFLQSVANVLSAAIDRSESEEEVRHRALHDPLTGLPNRTLFADRLAQALAHARRDRTLVAVLFCDLDQFKLVNDSLGHEAGDELLAAVAPRLTRTLRAGDTVARFGGDEFGILVEDIETERDATRAAERVAAALAAPFLLRGRELFVSATIGIAIGDGEEPPEALIRDSDLAMYRSKERGRGRYEIFDEVMRARAVQHLRTETDLRRALERAEFRVHYQPVVSLATGRITTLEALVRWEHPERGLVPPGEFIGLAEDSGVIVEIGQWVLESACRQVARWHRDSPDSRPIGISVNVSARQLADPTFPDLVRRALRETDLEPACLSLEVTESALIDEEDIAAGAFDRLEGLGVGLVLDDFGTGFSSLGYLRRLPFHTLKLDRSFISTLGSGAGDEAIVGGVASIAAALGMGVVAEGVETRAQLELVRSLGCQYAQGYLFAKPVPADDVGALLRDPVLDPAPVRS
jgi:diguanylate cyclase (GGDEF)-like protein/PAS domain S-box-containing protein